MRYRTPFGLCLMHCDGALSLYESGSERNWLSSILKSPLAVGILNLCSSARPEEEIVSFICEEAACDKATALATIEEMTSAGLLQDADDPLLAPAVEMGRAWDEKNWSAPLLFHWHTAQQEKMNYSADPKGLADKALMAEYLAEESPPPSYKSIEGREVISLPLVTGVDHANFPTVVSDELYRHQSEEFTIDSLSWFLKLAYGETGSRVMPVSGKHVGKTSPSGGSRHPTEAYLFIINVTGLKNGVYHYNVKDHALILLREGSYRDFTFKYLLRHKSRVSFDPCVVIVHATIFERSMFRYRESRSYRVMQYDLGHLLQTASYLARALRKKCYRSYTLDERMVEKEIGIDGMKEAAMAVVAIG